MKIKYLKHNEIDFEKWDSCLNNSINHLVYAESWYLNIVCNKHWNALVLEDYKAVMPLPLKNKLGLNYIQQPIWTQQLGIFSSQLITEKLVLDFIKSVPKKFKAISCNLNTFNECNQLPLIPKTNLILDLSKDYDTLKSSFSTNTKRNINKANKNSIELDFASNNVEEFIVFFKSTLSSPAQELEINILKQIISYSLKNNKGFIVNATINNELIATCFILKSDKRLIYRVARSNEQGKENKAMFLIVEGLIKKYSNTNYILDFEGSEIKGIARFYESYGATIQPYYYLKKHNIF